jgi:HEAT repeat protein
MVVLGRLGQSEGARHLIEALNDPSARVRAAAVAALPKVESAGMTSQLLLHLRNADPQVRAGVAAQLAGSDATQCVEPLVQALSDPAEDVRASAVEALGNFGRAVRRYEEALRTRQDDPSLQVRKAASRVLNRLRDVWAETPETSELPRRGRLSSAAAEEIVEAAFAGDLDPLLDALADRRSARRIAACLGDTARDKMAPVLSLLRAARVVERERATEALSQALRDGEAADAYIDQLGALDSDVRLVAMEIVGRLETTAAVQALVQVLEHDPLSEMRSRAASALAEAPDEAAKAALQRAQQQDPDRIVRSAAGRALQQIREAATPPSVVAAGEDSTTDLDSAQASA